MAGHICLVLHGAAHGGAALVDDQAIIARATLSAGADVAATLPVLVAGLLSRSGLAAPGVIAACTGPGSFTSLRATLALAAGLAMAWTIPAHGITVADAFADQFGHQAPLWVTIMARSNRIFLGQPTPMRGLDPRDLPDAPPGLHVAGDAAALVHALLAQRGQGATILPGDAPSPVAFARVARHMAASGRPPVLEPAYIDQPEARLPAA